MLCYDFRAADEVPARLLLANEKHAIGNDVCNGSLGNVVFYASGAAKTNVLIMSLM